MKGRRAGNTVSQQRKKCNLAPGVAIPTKQTPFQLPTGHLDYRSAGKNKTPTGGRISRRGFRRSDR